MFTEATSLQKSELSPSAIIRLKSDLKELEKYPIIGASAKPLDNKLSEWHCNIQAPDTSKYAGCVIHFVLVMPDNYPVDAPHAFFVTPITYYGGAAVKDSKGRMAVCLDLFGNFGYIHKDWKNDGQASGWVSTYTVTHILTNMQTAILGQYFSQHDDHIEQTRKFSLEQKCQDCGHCGGSFDTYYPPIPSADNVNSFKVDINHSVKNDIICYSTKYCFADKDTIFGYGIEVDPKGNVSSPCEYLSQEGFESGVRTSSTKKNFSYWMPIYITKEHYAKGEKLFIRAITDIFSKMKTPNTKDFDKKALVVLSSLMNSMVVEVMNSKNNLTANDKFIDGYFACYRLLLKLSETYPNIKKVSNAIIKQFIEQPDKRIKTHLPNLGTWLVTLSMANDYSWNDVAKDFIQENDIRNVFWYVNGTWNSPAKCPELADEIIVLNRLTKVFNCTETSRNLVCFQTKFMNFAKSLSINQLDENFGITPNEIKKELKEAYNTITKMKSWNDYFVWNGVEYKGDDARTKELCDAVVKSRQYGYHKNEQKQQYRKY